MILRIAVRMMLRIGEFWGLDNLGFEIYDLKFIMIEDNIRKIKVTTSFSI